MSAEPPTLFAVLASLAEHHKLATVVLAGLTLRGFLEFCEWMFAFLVDWLIKMSGHWHHLATALSLPSTLALWIILVALGSLLMFRALVKQ
jgi:hypothetical protein